MHTKLAFSTALLLISLAGAVAGSAAPALADPPEVRCLGPGEECGSRARTFHLARVADEKDVLRGPAELVLEGINRLKYDVVVGQEVKWADGPDLSLVPFIPPLGKVEDTPLKPPSGKEGKELEPRRVGEVAGRIQALQARAALGEG